jgi:NAD(P)-dependent dehydrogenase (short-subunit alcohol dehydrogenase family)
MYNPFSLEEKTILVTGASSGIGRETAIICSKLGAIVIATGRNEERLKETLSKLAGEGHRYIICNLQSSEQIDEMVKQLPEIHGLVNNAGMSVLSPINFIKEDSFKNLLQVDTVAPIILLQKILKKKLLKRGSSVVFTSSMAAMGDVAPGNSMYVACKGAISSFVQCAALELGPKGIRVNAVCPAMIDTPLAHEGVTEEQFEEFKKRYPLGTIGDPEDVGLGIAYLLSNASKWVTGTNMIIDGGVSVNY